jgi:hypothetical protein
MVTKNKEYSKEGPYGKIKTAKVSSSKKVFRVYKTPVMKMFGGWLANTHRTLTADQIRSILKKYGDRPNLTFVVGGWSFDEPKKRS